ncbi:UNVERIFIED_CONTAM: Pold3 [Trichonephila clavipes]
MSQNECFERLEELIMDEDRTVTYKLLSRECKIHVNLAKQYLHEFAEKQKSEIKNLHSTYFVAGYGNGGKGNDEWGLFRDDQHYNATLENNHNYSAIKNSNVEIKSPVLSKATNEQSNGLKKEAKVPLVPKVYIMNDYQFPGIQNCVTDSCPKSASFFKNVAKNSVEQKNNQDHHTENNVDNNADSTEVEKTKTSSPAKKQKSEKSQKSNTLASMWQKNEDKMKDVKEINSKSDAKPKAKETKPVAKNSIMNMFSKQAEKKAENNSKKSSVSHSTDTSNKTESTKEKLVSDIKPVELPKPKEEAHSSKPTSQKRKSSPRQSKTSSKQKNENKSDDESGPKKKKHRRICTFDDSDSESESEEAKDRAQRSLWEPEDPLEAVSSIQPATPASDDSEELIPPTPPVVSKGKKKVWKTIQKTFEEDGFLVTKQEKELVCEDDEDPTPQNIKNKEDSKPNPFTYRKQASLTSFFKQK